MNSFFNSIGDYRHLVILGEANFIPHVVLSVECSVTYISFSTNKMFEVYSVKDFIEAKDSSKSIHGAVDYKISEIETN